MVETLNDSAYRLCQEIADDPDRFKVEVKELSSGAMIIDAGAQVSGSLLA